MGWGSHCPDCGKTDCKWVHGPVCQGSLPRFLEKHATLESENASLRKKVEELAGALSTLQGAEQKPVAWQQQTSAGDWINCSESQAELARDIGRRAVRPLFAAPVALPDRDRVLEEAAETAERVDAGSSDERHRDTHYWAGFDDGCDAAARAIRALKSAERQP